MSNTTEKFVENIDPNILPNIMINFFEELMVLYNLLDFVNIKEIKQNSEASVATFIINTNNQEDALTIFNKMNQTHFEIYGTVYSIEMIISGNTSVTATIYRAT